MEPSTIWVREGEEGTNRVSPSQRDLGIEDKMVNHLTNCFPKTGSFYHHLQRSEWNNKIGEIWTIASRGNIMAMWQ